MHPIAQTFYINEPVDGSSGVYLTRLDLYFKSKSDTSGVTVQIRDTENGNPTGFIRPHASSSLYSSQVNISDDASVVTTFYFNSPVFLLANTSYAFVVIPDDYSEDYKIWTSDVTVGSGVDINGNPITKNNDTGTLFLSSNDRQFTAVQTEDIKFKLYRADFTSSQGSAVFTQSIEDTFYVKGLRGNSFQPTEPVYLSEFQYKLARLEFSANTGLFNVGETVYQSNSTANVALGKVYEITTSPYAVNLTNCTGIWVLTESGTYKITGETSHTEATVDTVYQNISTTKDSKEVKIPFTSYFSSGASGDYFFYFRSPSGATTQCSSFNSVVDSRTLLLNTAIPFTSYACQFGLIRGKGNLYGYYNGPQKGQIIDSQRFTVILSRPNNISNVLNFTGTESSLMIGGLSKASANVISTVDEPYNSITAQFSAASPPQSNIEFSFVGTNNDTVRTMDDAPIPLTPGIINELFDKERVLITRSHELSYMSGNPSLVITANLTTENSKISPVIDTIQTNVNFTQNIIVSQGKLVGYYLTVANTNGNFNVGDIVTLSNTSTEIGKGTILEYRDHYMTVSSIRSTAFYAHSLEPTLKFNVLNDPNTNAIITSASRYGEAYEKTYKYTSRYMSKTVTLDEGQDAEDVRCFLTAYRPAGSNFLVYAQLKHREDNAPMTQITWSLMNDMTAGSLISSSVNRNDFVELQYKLPQSKEIFNKGANCSSTSTIIKVPSTEFLSDDLYNPDNSCYIYIKDNNSSNFNVRKVYNIIDNINADVKVRPSFTSTNVAIGIIPTLNQLTSAFIYAENNNIVRYVDRNDRVYDGYKNFAIKIVPISDATYIVPRCHDMRAIALQI